MELHKPGPAGGQSQGSILREAMEGYKTEVTLTGEMCLDDSDSALPLIWSKGTGAGGERYIVCWKASDPKAEQMKDMVQDWAEFIVLDNDGRPLGSARDYFLTK